MVIKVDKTVFQYISRTTDYQRACIIRNIAAGKQVELELKKK